MDTVPVQESKGLLILLEQNKTSKQQQACNDYSLNREVESLLIRGKILGNEVFENRKGYTY